MTKKQIRKNQTLYNQYTRRLRRWNLSEVMKIVTPEEEIKRRQIYESYQKKLVQYNIVAGY